jgi:nucleotide-binding universal stress UspA family protein
VSELIASAEQRRCGSLFMGTHGRGGVPRVVLGSVAEGVIRRSRLPVVAVRRHEA